MRRDSGRTDSVWPTTRDVPTDGPVQGSIRADACVIGAGVVGLSTAYRLMLDGRKVVVLDDGPVGGGETARTTAHLVTAIDDRYHEMERLHGRKGARLVAQSHTRAVDATEELVRLERIACQWRRLPGYLFTPPRGPSVLEDEEKAARRAGLRGVSWVDRAPMPGIDTGRCLRYDGQATLQPLAFIRGLVRVLRAGGVAVHTPAHAARVRKAGDDLRVELAGGGDVRARHVIEATNSPVFGHHAIALKQYAYRTYVVAAKAPSRMRNALFWDTADPYHYVRDWTPTEEGAARLPLPVPADDDEPRPRAGERLLIVGGGDHHTGMKRAAGPIHSALASWAAKRFPGMGPVVSRWSGQVWEPVDSLAFIGRAMGAGNSGGSGRLYIATGDSGNGWTHGAIASMLLADLVAGRRNAWAELYSPYRKSARSMPDWAVEATHMAGQLTRVFQPGEARASEVLPGTGAIVRHGLHLVATFRDERGDLHERSAACRHLGCIVAWNASEQSWDCPCHGSRYDRFGTVVNGPANKDLKPTGAAARRAAGPRPDGVRAPRARKVRVGTASTSAKARRP